MSKQFTPCTEDVRTAWFQLTHNVESFDRWLYSERERVWNMMAKIERDSERERIRANIIDRVQDLSACTKRDNCEELGALIASYIEEWIDEGDPNE